jgi:outer membrane murein-binding lipoprotein Lpp
MKQGRSLIAAMLCTVVLIGACSEKKVEEGSSAVQGGAQSSGQDQQVAHGESSAKPPQEQAAIAGDANAGSPADAAAETQQAPSWVEPLPGLRVDIARKVIEFDGKIPIDPHDPQTPKIFLEVIVCSRDSREHESLIVTDVKPSHVHAGLIMLGLEPGHPGSWRWDAEARKMISTPPAGPPVEVVFIVKGADGLPVVHDPASWIINERETRTFVEQIAGEPAVSTRWVFAGSRIAPRPDGPGEYYKADIEGTLVGLATFGTETIAIPAMISPEAAVEAPVWIADRRNLPKWGTAVTVRITAK